MKHLDQETSIKKNIKTGNFIENHLAVGSVSLRLYKRKKRQ